MTSVEATIQNSLERPTRTWMHRVLRALADVRIARKHPARMQVLEQISVGGKRSLALVRVDGWEYLVGGGADAVHTMLKLHPEQSEQRGEDASS